MQESLPCFSVDEARSFLCNANIGRYGLRRGSSVDTAGTSSMPGANLAGLFLVSANRRIPRDIASISLESDTWPDLCQEQLSIFREIYKEYEERLRALDTRLGENSGLMIHLLRALRAVEIAYAVIAISSTNPEDADYDAEDLESATFYFNEVLLDIETIEHGFVQEEAAK